MQHPCTQQSLILGVVDFRNAKEKKIEAPEVKEKDSVRYLDFSKIYTISLKILNIYILKIHNNK